MTEEESKIKGEVDWKEKLNSSLESGYKIVENSFGNDPSGVMKHYGQGSGTLTKEWDNYFIKMTGKSASSPTKTPKTDMILGSANISLKKYGGSQLMSGSAAESIATLTAAMEMSAENGDITDKGNLGSLLTNS